MENNKDLIVNTLGNESEDDRYYVYALCDERNHIPFYIGKGQGDRIWNHELEATEQKEKLKYTDINTFLAEHSEKINKINELTAIDKLEHVIIKWGLTENEAFMAESALINMLNYKKTDNQKLKNKVNGHSSVKEKNSNSQTTQALSIREFEENNCNLPVMFTDSKQNCIFIGINVLYKYCLEMPIEKRANSIKESVRGYWPIDDDSTPKYVVALYHSRIKGIYEISEIKSILDDDTSSLPAFDSEFSYKIRDFETSIINMILKEGKDKEFNDFSKELQNTFINYCVNFDVETQTKINNNANFDFKDIYSKWKKRKYFIFKNTIPRSYSNYIGNLIERQKPTPTGKKQVLFGRTGYGDILEITDENKNKS